MDSTQEPNALGTIGIVGLGAVGLPLAALFARDGAGLVLYDTDEGRVATLRKGQSPLAHLDPGVVGGLAGAMITTAAADLARCGSVILCVPTPLLADRTPDLSAIRAAATSVAEHVAPDTLIVLESTTWPGTTREVLGEIFAGRDVQLAYSPERVDPGRDDGDPLGAKVPKLVGGVTPSATERAVELYARAFETVVPVASSDVAEAAKLVENVYRAVNIALVGELKVAFDAMNIDIWDVLAAAETKPFGFTRFDPGPGMGGHCLPIDPFYLSWAARRAGAETRFVELSGEINRSMPLFVAAKVEQALESREIAMEGARVLLLGVAYKAGVDIVEESPAFPLAAALEESGAIVAFADPLVPRCALGASVELDEARLRETDVVVLLIAQPGLDLGLIVRSDVLVVDTRAALRDQLLGDPRYISA